MTRTAILFTLCAVITASSAFAITPFSPRPVKLEGTLSFDGYAATVGDAKPVILVGPLTNAIRTCAGMHVILTGYVKPAIHPMRSDLVAPPADMFFNAFRLSLVEHWCGTGLYIFEGTLEKAGSGTYRLGDNTFIPIAGLRAALDKCLGLKIVTVGEPAPVPMYLPAHVKAARIVSIAMPTNELKR